MKSSFTLFLSLLYFEPCSSRSPKLRDVATRHGEKLYETLLSREELACAQNLGGYFRVPPDGRDLNYAKFVEHGEQKLTQTAHGEDYNSHNTQRLDVAGMKHLLLKLEFMQKITRGEPLVVPE